RSLRRQLRFTSIQSRSATSSAMFAVWMARLSTLVYWMSGRIPDAASSSPARLASARPWSLRSTSTHPVNRFFWFQSELPWRRRTRVKVMRPVYRKARDARSSGGRLRQRRKRRRKRLAGTQFSFISSGSEETSAVHGRGTRQPRRSARCGGGSGRASHRARRSHLLSGLKQHGPAGNDRRAVACDAPRRSEDAAVRVAAQLDEVDRGRAPDPDEVGQDRHRVPRLDELDVRLQVRGLKAHVRLEPGLATGLLRPVPGGRAAGLHDPRHPGGVGNGTNAETEVGRRNAEAQRIRYESLPVELRQPRRRVPRILLRDDEIEVASPGLEQRRLGLA